MLNSPVYAFVRKLCNSCLALIAFNCDAVQLLRFEGVATDQETSGLLYIESHQIVLDESGNYLSAYVAYRNPEGVIFAEKTLDYSKSFLSPDMLFHDKRSDEHTTIFLDKEKKFLQVLVEQGAERKESMIEIDEPIVVVDAGFDRFIESRWQVLRNNHQLVFTFLAISRAKLIDFEVVELRTNQHTMVLELHPRNFFIKLLVKPIVLEYDLSTKRLMSFEGLTNIEKFEDGERTEQNVVARIDYRYLPLKAFSSVHPPFIKFTDTDKLKTPSPGK